MNIYTRRSYFVVKVAPGFLNKADENPTCASASASLACSGRSTPVTGHVPYFYITCNGSTFLGPDPYHFAPDFGGAFPGHGDAAARPYACAGESAATRPGYKLVGYFDPTDAACAAMPKELVYSEVTCEAPELLVTVEVVAEWQPSNGRPVGTYFSFEALDWVDVFGQSVEQGAVTKNVDQWRDGQIIWTGAIKFWKSGSAHPKPHGRTEPWIPRQFQNGDQLAPRPEPVSSPSIFPSRLPSTSPSISPSTSPTSPSSSPIAMVEVEADWQPSNGRPVGTYFSFEASDWVDVFGQSVKQGAVTKNVDQWRNGQIIWTGAIKFWKSGSAHPKPHGRTEPWIPGKFQNGDQLAPRPEPLATVEVEADWQPSNGRPVGTYFSFEASKWNDVFGQSVENGATTKNVEQWRNGQMVWNGAIKFWKSGSAHPKPHGRTEPWIPRHFQNGDQLAPRPERLVRVEVLADWQHSNGRPKGTYFSFEGSDWWNVFGTWPKHGAITKNVEQWRDSQIIWTGNIKFWKDKSKHGRFRGRTEPWIPGKFQNGDQLVPKA